MSSSHSFKRLSSNPEDKSGSALQRFLDSMKIGYIEWHDGIGYDLDALNELNHDELQQVEALIISRKDSDWRDVEALAALNTPFTIQALKECLDSPNNEARLFAVKFLKEMGIEDRIEEIVVKTLPQTKIGDGLTYALSLAETYPTERIRREVLRCAYVGKDDIHVHCAAMALYLYGKAASNFDTTNKIIFGFRETDPVIRMKLFEELCRQVGVDPVEILR
jgi:hypothetical protein